MALYDLTKQPVRLKEQMAATAHSVKMTHYFKEWTTASSLSKKKTLPLQNVDA